MTYAAMVAGGIPRGDDTSKGGRPTAQGRPNLGCPVDPLREGRCLRCLVRGHTAHDCRDPIRCRLCRQTGHRQTSCPCQQAPRLDSAGTGLFACLVGELHDADPSWEHILDGIRSTYPDLTNPDCRRLVSGQAFLRGISKSNWRRLHRLSWHFPEGGSITWHRPHNIDGAIIRPRTISSVEIRGIPFGYGKWRQLELLLQPVGDLRKIVWNGLQSWDPNCLCLDVEMEVDKEVLKKLLAETGKGAITELWLAVLPPPPSIPMPPTGSHSAASTEHTVALAQTSPGGGQHSPEQPACSLSPSQSRRRPKTPPVLPEAATEATPLPELDTSKTTNMEGETQGDGPRHSLLMYRSRRARRGTPLPSGECQSWQSRNEERQGVTGQAATQTAHHGLDEQEPSESTDTIPPGARKSPEESPDLSFIPETLLLLPAAEVAHQLGTGNGVLPNSP